MSQIEKLSFCFPEATDQQASAFNRLEKLVNPKAVYGSRPENQLPHLEVVGAKNDQVVSLAIDGTPLICLNDIPKFPHFKQASLREIATQFKGHIVRVDHMGLNLPADNESGVELLTVLSQRANLYRYPGGEPWYFAVPATLEEYQSEIADFSQLRGPKFELVLEPKSTASALIQMDFTTNLSRTEVEAKLPPPIGFELPGLGQHFRSVYVEHPWGPFLLRMDFRYQSDDCVNGWSSGEWLVKEGLRWGDSHLSFPDASISNELTSGVSYPVSYSRGKIQITESENSPNGALHQFVVNGDHYHLMKYQRFFEAMGSEHQPLLFIRNGFSLKELRCLEPAILELVKRKRLEPFSLGNMFIIPKNCFCSLSESDQRLIIEGNFEAASNSWRMYFMNVFGSFKLISYADADYTVARWASGGDSKTDDLRG